MTDIITKDEIIEITSSYNIIPGRKNTIRLQEDYDIADKIISKINENIKTLKGI